MWRRKNIEWVVQFLVAIGMILLVSACGTQTGVPTITTTPVDTPTPTGPQTYRVGDYVRLNGSTLIVLGWQNVKEDQSSKPNTGNKFIAVEVLIVNLSNPFSSLQQMSIKDDTGQMYSVDLIATVAAKSQTIDAEINRGEVGWGVVGFQLPENAKGLQFVFDASVFDSDKVFIDLGEEPLVAYPPDLTMYVGETKLAPQKVGDVIQIGPLALTVDDAWSLRGDAAHPTAIDNEFLVVDFTIQNIETSSISLDTFSSIWVKDSKGEKYRIDDVETGDFPVAYIELAPGEERGGEIYFEVPKDAEGFVFVFNTGGVFNDTGPIGEPGRVFVALTD